MIYVMKNTAKVVLGLTVLVTISLSSLLAKQPGKSPIKVFILAGQSNMEGQGLLEFGGSREADYKRRGMSKEEIAKKKEGVLSVAVKNPKHGERFKHIVDDEGNWVERDDVWVSYIRGRGEPKRGNLTVGYGARDDRIGPEFQFGHLMGEAIDNQVLIIKTSWGGKSLGFDFRPPSAGDPTFEMPKQREGRPKPEMSKYYNLMLSDLRATLNDLKKHFPEYDGEGYEIAGFVWHQGWNDGCNKDYTAEYETNMRHLIADVRKELGNEKLPFVVLGSGFGGHSKTHDTVVNRLRTEVLSAQEKATKSHKNTAFIDTRDCFQPKDECPGTGDVEHWYSNGITYFLLGDEAGKAMTKLLKK